MVNMYYIIYTCENDGVMDGMFPAAALTHRLGDAYGIIILKHTN